MARPREMLAAQPEGGVIINMSWDHVLTGMAGHEPAAVRRGQGRRARVQQVARAVSVAPRVRVNVLAPGWIETAFGDGLDADASHRRSPSPRR